MAKPDALHLYVSDHGKPMDLSKASAKVTLLAGAEKTDGVIVGAVVIKLTGWVWVDSAVAVLIGLWVLPRTWVLLKASLNILLEGVPEEIDIENVRRTLLGVPGVMSIHDLHVWALSSGKESMTVHVVIEPGFSAEAAILPAIRGAYESRVRDLSHHRPERTCGVRSDRRGLSLRQRRDAQRCGQCT